MSIIEFIRYYSVASLCEENEKSKAIPRHQIWNYDYFKEKEYDIKEIVPEEESQNRLLRQLLMETIGQQKDVLRTCKVIKGKKVLYAPFLYDAYYIAFLKTIGLCYTPLVAIAQDTWDLGCTTSRLNKLKYCFLRFIAKHGVDKLLFISPELYNHSKDYFNDPKKHIPLNHWGVDYDYYNDLSIGNDCPEVLKYVNPNYVYVTGGANRDFDVMSRLAALSDGRFDVVLQSNRCPEHIIASENLVVDRTPKGWKDLLYGYRNSMCVAVPLLQTLGYMSGITVVLEGMACGKPIISTYSPHYPFDIEKEKVGLYVPQGDEKAWLDAVRYLLDNPDEAREMGERGRKIIKTKHNYRMFCEELERHIKTCIH